MKKGRKGRSTLLVIAGKGHKRSADLRGKLNAFVTRISQTTGTSAQQKKTAVSSSRGSSSGSSIGQQINQIKTENSSKWVVIRFILAKLSQREGLNFELVIQVDVFVKTPNHIETHTMETIQD